MKEFKGTPGPWSVDTVNYHDYGIVSNTNGEEVTTLPAECAEHDFNAMLIAAAPELLEALRDLLIRTSGLDEYGEDYIFAKARQAIAKTLGESK